MHRSNFLPPGDITVVDGLPTTTQLRTAVDLSAVIPDPKRLRDILNDRLLHQAFTLGDFVAGFTAYACRGRRRVASWRPVLDAVNTETHYVPPQSVLESMLLDVLEAGGVPLPQKQQPLPTMEGPPGTVDYLYPPERLILEADGRQWHTTPDAVERDHQRDIEALARGYRTMRIGWRDLVTRPAWVCRMVTAALGLAPALAA